MTLKYRLEFFDYWHISSGLSAGAKLDSTVVKDSEGLPYVAGKIIKGLSREMAELLAKQEFVEKCFGSEGGKMGECYFSNAVISDSTAKQIVENKLQDNLYDVIASTQIGANGIAVDNSLREIEVVVPLTLEGTVEDVPQHYRDNMLRSLKMIKRMGLNRNRGLGRCAFSVEEAK